MHRTIIPLTFPNLTSRMNIEKRAKIQALLGGIAWVALLFAPVETALLKQITRLLWLAILVIFPLGLSLTGSPEKIPSIPHKVAIFLQPFAAAIVVTSYFLPKGVLAGTFAIVWLPLTLFAAGHGLHQLRERGWRAAFNHPAETCLSLAPLYLPIGAIWLLASRMGIEPFGFVEPIVSLTAIHFHYAGFAAPVLCGLAGIHAGTMKSWQKGLYCVITVIVMLGPALVAVGITFSRVVEGAAGVILALGYTGLALFTLGWVIGTVNGMIPRVLLGISSLAAIVTMLAAAGFALRDTGILVALSIPQMVMVHGWGNALGFVLCGLLGWGLHRVK